MKILSFRLSLWHIRIRPLFLLFLRVNCISGALPLVRCVVLTDACSVAGLFEPILADAGVAAGRVHTVTRLITALRRNHLALIHI